MKRFTPTALFITGGLLIWLANFVTVYVFAAVVCAKGFADMQLAGVRLVPLAVTFSNLLAGGATVALLLIACKRRHREQANEPVRFIQFLTLATCIIALLALVLLMMPAALVAGCYRI